MWSPPPISSGTGAVDGATCTPAWLMAGPRSQNGLLRPWSPWPTSRWRGPRPQGAQVVVHADADVIDGLVEGNGSIDDLSIPRESILRLLCDGQIEFHLDTPDGRTIGIGRVSQTVPRWLRRRIARRDGCCRFPGCERSIRHRHHIRWWSKNGPTDANNLTSS